MRRWLILVIVVLAFPALPIHAQGNDQAALEAVQTALDNFQTLDSYSADFSQTVKQQITVSAQGESVDISTAIDAAGVQSLVRHSDGGEDQQVSLEETVTVTQGDQVNAVGPITADMIVVDDRVYLRIDGPPAVMNIFPSGWQDITEGSDMPGFNLINIQSTMMVNNVFIAHPEAITVSAAEITSEEQDAKTLYHLTLDPAAWLDEVGIEPLRAMFNAEQIPYDLDAFIERMYTDEDTTLLIDITIEDGQLVGFSGEVTMAIEVGDLVTDPTLAGTDIRFEQHMTFAMIFYDHNQPVDIQAPVLGE